MNISVQMFECCSGNMTPKENWSAGEQTRGIDVDQTGNVYVAIGGAIKKFDKDGNHLGTFFGYKEIEGYEIDPVHLALDQNEQYLHVTGRDHIAKFDATNFNYMERWGEFGHSPCQFWSTAGIAIDNTGNIYVSDAGNHQISKFDSLGNCQLGWGSYGTGNGEFNLPAGIAIDDSGNVFVADRHNYRVQMFDSSGNFLAKWGTRGSGNGEFQNPEAVAIDHSGDIYVGDATSRIQKFTFGN